MEILLMLVAVAALVLVVVAFPSVMRRRRLDRRLAALAAVAALIASWVPQVGAVADEAADGVESMVEALRQAGLLEVGEVCGD